MIIKQLNKAALISTPILALYAIAPYFLLSQDTITPSMVLFAFTISAIVVYTIWSINVFFIKKRYIIGENTSSTWKFLLMSYFLSFILALVIIFILYLRAIELRILRLIYIWVSVFGFNTIIIITSGIVSYQSYQYEIEKEINELKFKNLEAEQQQLIQQLQPHFLFNALSTLKSLIKTDRELAEEYLIKLSDFLRFTVSSHKDKIVTFSDELIFTRDYIELQRIRFLGSVFCTSDIPREEIPKYEIPIYALQTLVENAFKHNAFTEENPLHLKISFDNGYLMVSNNKIPKMVTHKSGVGLQNLSKRYALFSGEEVKIEETADTFKVTIKLIQKK